MIPFADLSEVWGAAMWRASWQGGLAALAVWSTCRLLPSMPARFQAWLWRLALLKFVVVLLWSAPIAVPLLPATEPARWELTESTEPIPSIRTDEVISVAEHEPSGCFTPLLVGFLLWTVVVGIQAFRILIDYRAARRLRTESRLCENQNLCAELATASQSAGLRSPPGLLESEGDGSPMLIGILFPAIILPATTLRRLSDSERTMVIGHELAHVRRGDLFWNLIATVVRTAFFFHPLAWLGDRQLHLTQEIAADELSIALQEKDAVSYATLLVSILGKLGPHSPPPTMSVGAVGSIRSLKRRLSAMRFMKPVSRQSVVAYGIIIGLTAALGIVPWTLVAVQAQTNDKAEPKEVTVNGKYVSFKVGLLKIKSEAKNLEWKVAENTKVVSVIRGVEKDGVSPEAFRIWEPGAAISVKLQGEKVTFVQLGMKTAPIPDKIREKEPDKIKEKQPDKIKEKEPDKIREKEKEKDKVREKDKVGSKQTAGQNQKMVWGRLVAFKDDTVTIQTNSGALIGNKVTEGAKTMLWSNSHDKYVPAATFETLKEAKPGILVAVQVVNENVSLRVGARKGKTVGTFVSFKNDRLLILGKDLGESFVKKYGNNVHFNKFREDVPVYESVDGGPYQLVAGPTSKALTNIREGTVVTVHAEGDDNITIIQIGVPKKN